VASAYSTAYKLTRELQPDVVLANGILGSYLLGRHRDRWPSIAVIHHLYHDAWTYGATHGPRGAMPGLERFMIRRLNVDGIAVVNPAVESRLREYKRDSCVISFVGNGVDISKYTFESEKDPDCLVYIGRLRKEKRVQDVLETFAIVSSIRPNAVLYVVGDGPLRQPLRALAARLGLTNRVIFCGFMSEDEKIALLRRAAVYVSASRFEGFGIPPIEAMACGAVPVVSDIPAHRFVFSGRLVGWLVNSSAEMADRIVAVLQDDGLRRDRAREGRALVEQQWTWTRVARRYQELVEAVLSSRQSSGNRHTVLP
jgi:glycosyltransferase involved in cell wall biosynthesis